MESPWNIVWFSVVCFSASFLVFRIKEGIGIWLTAAFFVIPFGCWFAKINLVVGIGVFIVSSIVSLLLLCWLEDRAARKPTDRDPKTKQ
jgi:membrane protein implicated in regulation of membrane protease activity